MAKASHDVGEAKRSPGRTEPRATPAKSQNYDDDDGSGDDDVNDLQLSTALGSLGRALGDVSRQCPSDSPSPVSEPPTRYSKCLRSG